MNITLMHYSASPVVGGVESVIEHHARSMVENGHEVQIVAARGAQFDTRINFLQVPLIDSRHADVLAVKKELDSGIVSQKFHDLTRTIEAQLHPLLVGTDVIIAHNVCSLNKNLPLTAALFNLSKQNNFPRLILWHHDLAWTTPRYQKELHEGYPWDLLKTAWPNAAQVTISDMRQDELAELMKIEKLEIQVIPNGVDIGRFLKLEEQTLGYIRKFNLLQAKPLLLLPVRITPRKNIEFALQVLAELQKEFPFAQIVVTGPLGPHNPANLQYFESLQRLRESLGLRNTAHFLAEWTDEFIPDAVISDFYKLADALLFPSLEEGFGIPILEAGLAGIPVFCSNIPPLQKLGHTFATYFSPEENPRDAAQLILDHFKNDKNLGLRSMVRDQFTWERIYTTKIAPLFMK
ncbi:MAG: glycosyltransferase family 4 protein [Anaerolineales bacterium]|nr:glycosyltransferase family 4 protein [Anaerolineales bacterium]